MEVRRWRGLGFKLVASYGAVALLTTASALLGTRQVQRYGDRRRDDIEAVVDQIEAARSVAETTYEQGFAYALAGDVGEKSSCVAGFATLRHSLATLRKVGDLQPREAAVIGALGDDVEDGEAAARAMFADFDDRGAVSRAHYTDYEHTMDRLVLRARGTVDIVRDRADDEAVETRHMIDFAIVAIGVLALLASFLAGGILGRRIVKPLVRLRDHAIRFGRGDFAARIAATSRDEVGDLGAALQKMADNLEQLLRAQSKRLDDVLSISEMLIVCEADGTIASVNGATSRTLGYSEDELVGRSIASITATFSFDDLRILAHSGTAHIESPTDLSMQTKSGDPVPVMVSASALASADGRPGGLVCVAQDLTERRRLQGELRHAQKLEAVGRLASGVAHEINTPIQFVSDSVHFMKSATDDMLALIAKYGELRSLPAAELPDALARMTEEEDDADLPYLLENAQPAAERALEGLARVAAIVRSIKEFAHPDRSVQDEADINYIVHQALTIARNEYKYVAELEIELADLPRVRCYAGDLGQVVLNLVVNASHAMTDAFRERVATGLSNEDARGTIRVSTRSVGADVEIAIQDTGNGIPEKIREKIFDPFFTTKEVGRGSGQGLAIARATVVDKHGGSLSFETESGKGTTFLVRIPIGGHNTSLSMVAA